MPKSYSEQEREYIDRRLREEAMNCMCSYGIRKTTVDELVRRVRIPKGTFYLFYESKEQLLFQVLMQFHENVEKQLLERVDSLAGRTLDAETVTDLFMDFFRRADEAPILRLMNSGELEILARKLPGEELAAHFKEDAGMVEAVIGKLFPSGASCAGELAETFGGAFRAVFTAMIYSHEGGQESAYVSLRLLIRGLVLQLFELKAESNSSDKQNSKGRHAKQ